MVGIDIGTKSIKIVELEPLKEGWNLMGSGLAGYNGDLLEKSDDEVVLTDVAQVIKKIYRDAGIIGRDVGISLPESAVFTRIVKFPLLTDQEIASAIRWEAEQYIPIPISEAVVKYKILARDEKMAIPGVSVLLVAAPTVLVEKYIRINQLAGLNVIFVETELVALSRVLAPESSTAIILDFGSKATDIAIIRKGNLVFSRSIPTAGEALTRAVMQSLQIEAARAEEYKKTYGFNEVQLEGKVKFAMDPILGQITDEIKKAIHFYQTEEKGEVPTTIIITGGSSVIPDVISAISAKLGMEVVMGNPFEKVNVNQETLKKLSGYAHLYSIAAGVAMRTE